MPRKATNHSPHHHARTAANRVDTATLVDRYAAVKESIELLEKQKDKLRKDILATGKSRMHSDRYELAVQHVEQTRVNYQGLAAYLGATQDQIARFSHVAITDRIVVTPLSPFDTRGVAAAVKSLLE